MTGRVHRMNISKDYYAVWKEYEKTAHLRKQGAKGNFKEEATIFNVTSELEFYKHVESWKKLYQ